MAQSDLPLTGGRKKPETNIHAGHRERVRDRFLKYGAEQLEDHQLLELILFYSRAQEDVNPLAHRLIDRFGSLKAVLDAEAEDLTRVIGVSDHTAALLKLFPAVAARYQQANSLRGDIINSAEDAAEFLQPYFIGVHQEMVYLLSVDAKGKALGCDRISTGSADAVLLDSRQVVQAALRRHASQVFLAHCHVSGLAFPSQEDIRSTARLRTALEMLNIRLTDHLIFAEDDYISMRQSGLLDVPVSG